jgi:hypothetical protein
MVDPLPYLPSSRRILIMELNMTEHGFDVNVSYSESDDFDNSVVLSLINQLVEALRGVEDVNISISSEYAIDEDAEEVLADMESEYTDEEDSEEDDSVEEASEESDEEATTEEDQKDNH